MLYPPAGYEEVPGGGLRRIGEEPVTDQAASSIEDVTDISAMSIADIVKAFDNASNVDAVFSLLKDTDPPADPIDQQLLRYKLAEILKRWKIPVKAVDQWFKVKAIEAATAGIVFPDQDPWPDPVDGAELVADLERFVARFVHATEESVLASALWVLWTHVFDLFDIAPLFVVTSPTKRCGKTTLLKVVGSVAAYRLFSSNLTGAVLFRVIEQYRPTLLIDEADNFSRFNDELKGLLNAGHERMTAQATRTVGDDFQVRTFSTWAPKAFTAIGALPDTIEDRSLRVVMLRKPTELTKERARSRILAAGGDPLRRRCARWALDNAVALRTAGEPELPDLHDRAADNWSPLIMVADLCGVRERAENAATILTGEGGLGLDELLLLHVREAFGDHDRMSTTEILEALVTRDDAPWAKFWASDLDTVAGRKKASAALARRLRKFDPGLKAERRQEQDERARGYDRVQFEDVWARWLPPADEHHSNGPQTLATSDTLDTVPDLGHRDEPLTSGNAGTDKVAKVAKVPEVRESVNPGDIVRVDRIRSARFKVKCVENGVVDAWELEAGMAGRLRSFQVDEVLIVKRSQD